MLNVWNLDASTSNGSYSCLETRMSDEMTMRPSELCGIRDAMRTMPKLIQALNDGKVEKFVLMKRGRVVAVMLDIEDYSEMVEKAKESNAT